MTTNDAESIEFSAERWSIARQLTTLGLVLAAFALMISAAATGIVGFGHWKAEMERREMEQTYQDGMQVVQETFTDYLLENYAGVTAIEWEGVEIEWRDSPIHGPSLFGNGVTSTFRVYVNDEDYFTRYFRLDVEMDYDQEREQYVPNGVQTPQNMDLSIMNGLNQAILDRGGDPAGVFSGIRKSAAGSPHANVAYDLHTFDFANH